MKNNNEVLDLANIDPAKLPELVGWVEKQNEVVKANPFIKIKDRESYENAKANRTALVTARTTINKQKKTINDKLNAFKAKVGLASDDLIKITLPHEEKQQEEVKKHENIQDSLREEKRETDRKRVEKIKNAIEVLKTVIDMIIDSMEFSNTLKSGEKIENEVAKSKDLIDYEEFYVLRDGMLESQSEKFAERVKELKLAEKQRLENIVLAQKAKINELYVSCSKIIQVATIETMTFLLQKVTEHLDIEFDFGDQQKDYNDNITYLKKMAEQRIVALEKESKVEEENAKKDALILQGSNLSDLQSHLMVTIINMDADNYELTTPNMEELEKESKGYYLIQDKFYAMIEIIQSTLDEKLALVKKELENRANAQQKKWAERKEMIIMLGMEEHKDGVYRGFGYKISGNEVMCFNDVAFEDTLKKIQELKSEFQNNEERAIRLKNDKVRLNAALDAMYCAFGGCEALKSLTNTESISRMEELDKELSEWWELKVEQLGTL